MARERSACLLQICTQLQGQVQPGSPMKHTAPLASAPAKGHAQSTPAVLARLPATAVATSPVRTHNGCLAALARSMQQQQQLQTSTTQQQAHSNSPVAADTQPCHCCGHHQPYSPAGRWAIPAGVTSSGLHSCQQSPGCSRCLFEPAAVAASRGPQQQASPAQPTTEHLTEQEKFLQSDPCDQQSPMPSTNSSSRSMPQAVGQQPPRHRSGSGAVPAPLLSGLVGQLQAGVAALQQQLSSTQQHLLPQARAAGSLGSPSMSR